MRWSAALLVVVVLALAGLAAWLVLGSGRGASGEATSPHIDRGTGEPGTVGPDGARLSGTGDARRPTDRTDPRTSRPGDSVNGARVPHGIDLSDPAVAEGYLNQLLSDRPRQWRDIAHVVAVIEGRLPDQARETLLAELKTGNRISAVKAISGSRDGTLVPELLLLLDDPDLLAGARGAVAQALALVAGGDPAQVVVGLEARLVGDPRADVVLLQAIGHRGGREAGRALVEYIRRADDPAHLPDYAFLRFDVGKDAEAAAVVVEALDSTEDPGQLRALLKIAGRPGADAMVESLARLDRDGQPEEVRREALRTLAGIGTPLAVEHLLATASHKGPWSKAALESVGHINAASPEARKLLLEALEDTARTVDPVQARRELLRALGNVMHAEAVEPLADALAAPDVETRLVAVRGLGRLRAVSRPHVDALVVAYSTGEPAVKRRVVMALGAIGGDEARSALQQMAQDDSLDVDLKPTVALALKRLGHVESERESRLGGSGE